MCIGLIDLVSVGVQCTKTVFLTEPISCTDLSIEIDLSMYYEYAGFTWLFWATKQYM